MINYNFFIVQANVYRVINQFDQNDHYSPSAHRDPLPPWFSHEERFNLHYLILYVTANAWTLVIRKMSASHGSPLEFCTTVAV